MPQVEVVYFLEGSGRIPMLEWLESLPDKVLDKCMVKIERLQALGHELRRPEADILRDGVYELRVSRQGIHYRMLYFFYGNKRVVLSHGIVKKREVPIIEIKKALENKMKYESNSSKYTYQE